MIKYRNLKQRWVDVTDEQAKEIATKLYKLSKDEKKLDLINKRFIGKQFTKEEIGGSECRCFGLR